MSQKPREKMVKKYYLCMMIGDGSTPENGIHSPIEDIVDPATGLKAYTVSIVSSAAQPWGLVLAAGQNHELVAGRPGIFPLPAASLDQRISAIPTVDRAAMSAKLIALGIDVSSVSQGDGYRQIIRKLGRAHRADFHEDSFDVIE